MTLILITFQIFEWLVMINIIKTQMGRSVEEITFDHNHERITQTIEKGDKNNFRRKEKRL